MVGENSDIWDMLEEIFFFFYSYAESGNYVARARQVDPREIVETKI